MACVSSYNKKVVIEKLSGTVDAHGFVDNTSTANWLRHTTSFASVKSKGGREFWKVDQVSADVSHAWNLPYSSELAAATPDMRLISEGVTYEILSVIDIDLAHREIEIQTKVTP